MNPIEIAYFKHFMLDKSEHMKFLVRYRKCKLDGNPESFESYLLKTTVKDVILKAFFFRPDNVGTRYSYTYNYWKEVDDAWQKYWPLMENNNSNERWWDLKATFAILRQNWDKQDFYLKENMESVEDTFKRLCVERPIQKVEEPEPQTTVDDPLADFELFDVTRKSTRKLQANEVSININNSNKITFNMIVSDVIIKSGLKFARLGKNKAGDICIIFNNDDGIRVVAAHGGNRCSTHVAINNKDACEKVRTLFNITKDYDKLNIETLHSTPEYLIYKLTKQ